MSSEPQSWLEVYKALGATAGILSAGFIVWDRMLRGRPLVTWCRDGDEIGLRISNNADENVLIKRILFSPATATWQWDAEVADIADALSRLDGSSWQKKFGKDDGPGLILRPDTEKILRVCFKDNEVPSTAYKCTIEWAFMRWRWVPSWPITLHSREGELARIKQARFIDKVAKT